MSYQSLSGIPRFRSRNNLDYIYGSRTTVDGTCGTLGTFQTTAPFKAAIIGSSESIEDVVTPNFKKRSAMGEIIISPMQKKMDIHQCSGQYGVAKSAPYFCPAQHEAYEYYYGPWLLWRVQGQPSAGAVPGKQLLLADSDIASAISVASTAAWSAANAHNADILTDIAELRQTLSMLKDPLKTTSALLRNIKTKQRSSSSSKLRNSVDYANSQWLQYRYGVRPLVKSVQGVVKTLKENRERRRSTYRGSYSINASSFSTGTHAATALTMDYSYSYTDSLSVRTGMIIEDFISLAENLGVDASGMLALPWELVPYSFVADWFANTNHFLQSLVPYLTKNSLGGWVTSQRVSTTTFRCTATRATNPSAYSVVTPCDEVRTSTFLVKTRNVGLPSPVLTWKPQALHKVLDDLRIVDAFSLTANLFFSTFKM